MKDRSLHSGERQVSQTLDGIEHWHKWRYNFAKEQISPGETVLDLGCGCGYGSFILSEKAGEITAIDDSFESICFAKKFYGRHNIIYCCCDIFGILGQYDTVVIFEIIEHLEFTNKIFEKLGDLTAKRIILSVPEAKTPLLSPFHYRHFTKEEITTQLNAINFIPVHLSEPVFQGGAAVLCVAERKAQ